MPETRGTHTALCIGPLFLGCISQNECRHHIFNSLNSLHLNTSHYSSTLYCLYKAHVNISAGTDKCSKGFTSCSNANTFPLNILQSYIPVTSCILKYAEISSVSRRDRADLDCIVLKAAEQMWVESLTYCIYFGTLGPIKVFEECHRWPVSASGQVKARM